MPLQSVKIFPDNMSSLLEFHRTFQFFNWIFLIHGLSAFLFSRFYHYRSVLLSSVFICAAYWFAGGIDFINIILSNYLEIEDQIFLRIFNLVDITRWCCNTLNLHVTMFVHHKRLQRLIRELFTVSRQSISGPAMFSFRFAFSFILFYFYFGVLYMRWTYTTNYGSAFMVLPIYCFQSCILSFEQMFLLIFTFQVKTNLASIKVNLADLRVTFDTFDKNLELFEDIIEVFSRAIILSVLNLLLGPTFFIFVGFVQKQWTMAFYEHFMWDWLWFILICWVLCMHQVHLQVGLTLF